MNISKKYMYLWCVGALFQSSLFAMRAGVSIPTVPASWMAKRFSYGVTPEAQSGEVPQVVNPELMRSAQEELRLEQPYVEQTQPVWSTQEMRPAYVAQQPSYDFSLDDQAGVVDHTKKISKLDLAEGKTSKKDNKFSGKRIGGIVGAAGTFFAFNEVQKKEIQPLEQESKSVSEEARTPIVSNYGAKLSDDQGRTDLSKAIKSGDVNVVKALVEEGADVKKRDATYHRNTIMHRVAEYGHPDMVKILSDAGADMNARDSFNQTPLQTAVESGRADMVAPLVKFGADVNNVRNANTNTPLHYAAQHGDAKMVRALLDVGADMNVNNSSRETPLSLAIKYKNTKAAEALLNAGAGTTSERIWYKLRGYY